MPSIPTSNNHRFLIWGGNGWVAGLLYDLLKSQGKHVETTTVRMENRPEVQRVLDEAKPTHVFNCAGKTGRPNVDWCDKNPMETVDANVIGTMTLAYQCEMRDIHLTVFATGCECHECGGEMGLRLTWEQASTNTTLSTKRAERDLRRLIPRILEAPGIRRQKQLLRM